MSHEIHSDSGLPPLIGELCLESELRLEGDPRLLEADLSGFVGSDPRPVFVALSDFARSNLPAGPLLCEWGSGLGIVAMMAAHLGFEAHGIEIKPELVLAARELADDFGFEVSFAEGTFVPGNAMARQDRSRFPWDDGGAPDGHEELELTIGDYDVVFAYPWPGEEWAITEVFREYATPGAFLITYQDALGVRAREKLSSGDLSSSWELT